LPQLRRADRVHRERLHRVRCLRRHLPHGLHHLHGRRRGSRVAPAPEGAGPQPGPGPVRRRAAEDGKDHGEGRGRVPALRALRGALPHRRVGHAEVPAEHHPGGTPGPRGCTGPGARSRGM
ncbi:MAG: Glutamate synthase [NADPH] small chain, partial [uncultured Ramlibacter sp.]